MNLSPAERQELADAVVAAGRAGGAQLMHWRGKFATHTKGPSDYVTDADLASQEAIREYVAKQFPDHQFIGEESTEMPEIDPDRLCWIVDPLDGTTNYLHDFPSFAVSVAIARGSTLIAGAIFDPLRDEMFSAAAGLGAKLGETPLHSSPTNQLSDALVAISLPASVHTDSPDLQDFVRIAPHCQAVRRIGSAALNLAYVASGRLDAYWAREIHAWDIAAGALLVVEAGGCVTDASGGPLNLWSPPCIASCGEALHRELLERLEPAAG